MEIVNGYVCRTCCDVDLAKRGVDPAHPKDDPKNPAYDPAKAAADKAKDGHGPAFQLGGALKAHGAKDASGVVGAATNALPPVNGVQASDGAATAPAPQNTQPGSVLNIAA
ncbi:hypothetical protein ACO2Q3_03005 [Caulobacter sp. KR2-114]|uniref:hypothetical protein n=1 Tax=Caulobacter sp. KR2-114 TaxID=3400912 RepID=UPI003C03BB07